MLIKPFHKYVIICRGIDKLTYRWHLKVEPGYNAWRIVNQIITIGEVFKGFFILWIEDVTNNSYGENCNELNLWEKKQSKINIEANSKDMDDFEDWDEPISEEEFDYAVRSADIGFVIYPSYHQSYRCQICGGVVANDICTDCLFDWDS